MKKVMTLCMITDGDKILLGMKKRGFGEGKWNGFGGKVEDNEDIEEAARRELLEEIGINIKDSKKRSVLTFTWENKPDILEVHVFEVLSYSGKPQESEEMKPQWFSYQEIPFSKMWSDDIHWLPLFLQGKNTIGNFLFNTKDELIEFNIDEVEVVN